MPPSWVVVVQIIVLIIELYNVCLVQSSVFMMKYNTNNIKIITDSKRKHIQYTIVHIIFTKLRIAMSTFGKHFCQEVCNIFAGNMLKLLRGKL